MDVAQRKHQGDAGLQILEVLPDFSVERGIKKRVNVHRPLIRKAGSDGLQAPFEFAYVRHLRDDRN